MSEIDEAMQMLGVSLNLADPTSTLSGALAPKQDIDEITSKIWASIHDDYRRLSDSLLERSKPGPTHSVNTSRDNQFADFAKLLLKEMLAQTQWNGIDFNADDTEEVEDYSLIIARRAYDLVYHTLSYAGYDGSLEHTIGDIPDMAIWPEETKNNG